MKTRIVLSLLFLCLALPAFAQNKTRNIVLIVLDGVRWQEVFTGADPTLMNSEHGNIWLDEKVLKQRYWRDDVEQRRRALFPFLWGTVAQQGQIFGNQNKGSIAHVSNGMAFSYPGYNEMSVGYPDSRIDSNEYGPNPNRSVFEWLNTLPEFKDKVAVFATWANFHEIFNQKRSRLYMQVGWDLPGRGTDLTPRQQLLNQLFETTTRMDAEDATDSLLQVPLLDYVREQKPRVLFVGYGEPDSWAHAGRYDVVLESLRLADQFIQQLWQTMQSMPEYRDQTTFLITTDHGRGGGLVQWREHGVEEKGSENVWMAVLGPDTPALGEREKVPPVVQAQIAATLAAFIGQDYRQAEPKAAAPLPVIGK
ncbi:MAG: alkaline phosphatase family protein [Acidobacteria bacterium]|nr:alkaline phosphatase family protein [Acidobacteriota bacterium]